MTGSIEAKIVVLGSQGVGKTSLVHRYVNNEFTPPSTTSTIGASFLTKRVSNADTSTIVRLQIWDTAGQERFRSISKLYYRGANAGILCYDITDTHSFEEMGRWLHELKQNLDDDAIIHVVGTKSDLVAQEPSSRKVPFDRCISYVTQNLYPSQHAISPTPYSSIGTWGSGRVTKGAGVGVGSSSQVVVPGSGSSRQVSPTQTGGVIASPNSNRSSDFWGQDAGWDCCHEISSKSGEGVDEVFRIITRKLVEQHYQRLDQEHVALLSAQGGMPVTGRYSNAYADRFEDGGSLRISVGDMRRSWLGIPTTVSGQGAMENGGRENGESGNCRGKCC